MFRIGIGYDIHRVGPGRGLRLGGVSFPHTPFSLLGHSDADVIVHAACDALLGAAGLPDIGTLFPDGDARYRKRNSLDFLRAVRKRLERAGYLAVNLDCTLIAEAPRIQARVGLMRSRLAQAAGLTPAQVAVKATTNEGVGFIGRGEGLAAIAVALLTDRPPRRRSSA